MPLALTAAAGALGAYATSWLSDAENRKSLKGFGCDPRVTNQLGQYLGNGTKHAWETACDHLFKQNSEIPQPVYDLGTEKINGDVMQTAPKLARIVKRVQKLKTKVREPPKTKKKKARK